jgi:putative polymerase
LVSRIAIAHPSSLSTLPAVPMLGAWPATGLVLAAMLFNLLLCLVNTSVMGIGELHVVASEALILALVLLAAYRSIDHVQLILIGCAVLWPLSLASIRFVAGTDSTIDIKIVRDLAIPFAFFFLGMSVRNVRVADRIVAVATAIVLVFALFEYFWIDVFTRFFNIAKYYIARGTMEAKSTMQSADLFISGMRPAGAQGGRNLFPFLGDHRVSSVFLEPVSLGNFGVIAFIWALVRSKIEGRMYMGLMIGAAVLIVLADSRFGAYLCAIATIVAMLPIAWSTPLAVFLPLVSLVVLAVVPILVTGSYDPQNRYIDNGFVGRFVLSARILSDFDLATWFGLKATAVQAFDSGYAYVISKIGIVGLVGCWFVLFAAKQGDRQFCLYRNLVAIYLGTILCVSNSPFTIKTGALLWLLLGIAASAALHGEHAGFHKTRRPGQRSGGFAQGHPSIRIGVGGHNA